MTVADAKVYPVTMTIELTQDQERLIQSLVATGRYPDDRAVLSQSLKLIQEYESRLSLLRAEIQKGLDSGDSAPLDMEAIKAEARRRYNERHAQ